jgi:hypothetical protein
MPFGGDMKNDVAEGQKPVLDEMKGHGAEVIGETNRYKDAMEES